MLKINFVHHVAHDASKKLPLNYGEEFVIAVATISSRSLDLCLFDFLLRSALAYLRNLTNCTQSHSKNGSPLRA